MRLSRTPLSLTAWFALGATVAVAAPTPAPSGDGPKPSKPPEGPKPQLECPTPDKAKCLSEGYLDGKCGQKHVAVCKPFAQEAMQAHYEAKAAPKLKMLRPQLSEMPRHVVQGKYFAYKKKAGPQIVDQVYRKVGDVLAGVAGMDMTSKPPVDRVGKVDPAEAAQFHRKPEWRDNGAAVRSCEEYAYARSYNATRFIDASSACRGDRECVFAVAYLPALTGIAGHKLLNEDGVVMDRQLVLPKGRFQKNDMFAPGLEGFFEVTSATLPNGMVVQNTTIAGLKSALKAGKDYYDIGACSGASCDNKTRFKDVWEWHKTLHTKTAAISQNEAEEYERRRAKLRALLEQWSAAVNKEKSLGKGIELKPAVVLPFDMRASDPFERYEFEREYIERGRETRQLFKQRYGEELMNQPRSVVIPILQQKQQMQGSWQPSGGMAAGLLAAPAPTPKPAKPQQGWEPTGAGSTAALDHTQAFMSDGPQISNCVVQQDWGFEMMYAGPITCRIREFLLAEWQRKLDGQKSCLDLGNTDCDWTLEMFETGVLAQVQKLDVQVADLSYCKAYKETNTFTDDADNGGLSRVTIVKKRLDATKRKREEELKGVSQFILPRTGKGQPLGKDWNGGELSGDKDWFAAGYDYSVGWEVGPAKTENDIVCQVEGSAHGDMSFDAWIIGGKISVVDGAVRAEAKPANGGTARFNAHLEMMGQSVFNTDGWKTAQTFQPGDDVGFGVQVPSGLKPRFDIYVGVPISGQMWGELLFGSALGLSGSVSSACNSEISNPKFGIHAKFMPFFGAFGIGKVGVGIAGVASAGVRASLTLLMLGLPLDIGMTASMKDSRPTVSFASELSMFLATLSGRVSLYVEFLMFEEEFELFRWKGFSTEVPLMPKLTASVSFGALK